MVPTMLTYVLARGFRWITGLIAVIFLTFTMLYYGGGNPIDVMVNQGNSLDWPQERIDYMKERFGYDQPFYIQFQRYVSNLVQGEFGYSVRAQRPVGPMMTARVPVSVQLGLAAAFFTLIIGIPLGLLAAYFHRRWPDSVIMGITITSQGIPEFVLGPMLTVLFVLWLGILDVPVGWNGLFNTQLILPLIVLTIGSLPIIVRQTRSSVLDLAKSDYIRTARAKGMSDTNVLLKHMLRPALIPVTTTAGLMIISLVNGAIFVETIFNIPGIGNLSRQATIAVDYPVVMALVIITTLMVMVANLLVDLCYPLIDPRIRRS